MILESMLRKENISFEVCNDVKKMRSMGIMSAPVLGVGDRLLSYDEVISELPNLA